MQDNENPVPTESTVEINQTVEASSGKAARRPSRRRPASRQPAVEIAPAAVDHTELQTEDNATVAEAIVETATPSRRPRTRGRRATPAVSQEIEQRSDELAVAVEQPLVEVATEAEPAPPVESLTELAPADTPDSPSNPWAPRRRYEIGPDGKVRFLDAHAGRPAAAVEPPETEEAAPLQEPPADQPAPIDLRRPRGRRRGDRRLEPDEPAVIATETVDETVAVAVAQEAEPFIDDAAEIDLGIVEGEATVEDDQQTPERRRRRSRRGGRGRRRNGNDLRFDETEAGEALEPALAEAEGIALPDEAEAEPAPAMITPLRERPDRSASNLSPLESLVARQNVILDQLLQRQERMARSMEQALKSVEARLRGTDLSRVSAMPRLAVFVDVPNIMYAAERYRVNVDFGKLLDYVAHDRTLIRASAYAPISDDPSQRLEVQRFVEPFVNHGYRIVTKPLKRFADGSIKANFDVELAMDILTMSDRLDIVSLVSGDGDFRRLVDIVASKGVRVEVVSFAQSTSAELKAVADTYVDLTQHLKDLCVPVEGDFRPRVPRPRIDISGYYE